MPGKTVSTLLQKLVDAGFARKGDGEYVLADPMLRRAALLRLI